MLRNKLRTSARSCTSLRPTLPPRNKPFWISKPYCRRLRRRSSQPRNQPRPRRGLLINLEWRRRKSGLLRNCQNYAGTTAALHGIRALNVAGAPADSAWRLPENVFCPPQIREVPADAPETSEQPTAIPDAIPIAETTKGSSQVTEQGEDSEGEKGKSKGKGKKPSSKSKDSFKEKVDEAEGHGVDPKAKDVPPSQPEQKEDPPAEVQPLGFFSFFFFSIILKKSCILFLLSKTSCLIVLYYLYFLT